jgi:hypothetical protein
MSIKRGTWLSDLTPKPKQANKRVDTQNAMMGMAIT